MDTQGNRLPTKHKRPSVGKVLLGFTIAATSLYWAYFLFSPTYFAAKIEAGDSAARVRQLLGEPALVFETTDELLNSSLRGMSYVFTNSRGRSGIPIDDLPPIAGSAEWYPYASAGHLVYFDENGVVAVYWGGT